MFNAKYVRYEVDWSPSCCCALMETWYIFKTGINTVLLAYRINILHHSARNSMKEVWLMCRWAFYSIHGFDNGKQFYKRFNIKNKSWKALVYIEGGLAACNFRDMKSQNFLCSFHLKEPLRSLFHISTEQNLPWSYFTWNQYLILLHLESILVFSFYYISCVHFIYLLLIQISGHIAYHKIHSFL